MNGTFILTPKEKEVIDNLFIKETFSAEDINETVEIAGVFADYLDFPAGSISDLENKNKAILKAALEYYYGKIINEVIK